MQGKIIAAKVTQDDIDWLKMRAAVMLRSYFDSVDWQERTHYFFMFQQYWELYLANKDRGNGG